MFEDISMCLDIFTYIFLVLLARFVLKIKLKKSFMSSMLSSDFHQSNLTFYSWTL